MGLRKHTFAMVVLSVLVPQLAAAEPSLGEAQKHVDKKDLISCKFLDKGSKRDIGAFTSRSGTRWGPTKGWWRRTIQCTYKAPGIKGAPNAKLKLEGEMWWAMAGGKFQYDSWSNWRSYDGIPSPTEAELAKLIRDNWIDFLTYNKAYKVTSIGKIALADEPKWWWTDPDRLKVHMVFEFEEKEGSSLVALRIRPTVELKRAEIAAPWKIVSSHNGDPRETISERKLSAEEAKAVLPMITAEANSKAKEKLASLPTVEIPSFADEHAAVTFTLQMLREADAPRLESYLRQMLSARHLQDGTALLSSTAEELIKKALEASYGTGPTVKDQYCARPWKDRSDRKYYNKDESRHIRLTFTREGGEFQDGKKVNEKLRIADLKIGMATGDALAKLTSYSKDPCTVGIAKPDGGQWLRGDLVTVTYADKRKPGYIEGFKDGMIVVVIGPKDVSSFKPELVLPR